MSDQLASRVERVANFLDQCRVKVGEPLDWDELGNFEAEHAVILPEAYTLFLTEIGNGCAAGPPAFGLLELGCANGLPSPQREYYESLPRLGEPFPYTRRYCWDPPGEEPPSCGWTGLRDGNLFLGTDGCEIDYHLIVTGPERGRVWRFDHAGIQPVEPYRDFLEWFEAELFGSYQDDFLPFAPTDD